MINITPPPPIKPKVEKTQVPEKDPHHDQDKKKKKDNKGDKRKDQNQSPMQGHIDIEV